VAFDGTFVVARWARPLAELSVNSRLVLSGAPHPELTWARSDGWQCFFPDDFYDGELVPPVLEISQETAGPVLGIGVNRNYHYRLSFVEGGELQTIAEGEYEDESEGDIRREMVQRWGEPWQHGAAESLRRWAQPFAKIPYLGVFGALAVPHV
jgi:hypothetical protein